jgi:hypothetical protein
MICHVCRNQATGQCKSCGKFYCSDHGDVFCMTCSSAVSAKPISDRPSTPGVSVSPTWTSHALEWGIGSVIIGIFVCLLIPLAAAAAAIGVGTYLASGYALVAHVEATFDLTALVVSFLLLLAAIGLWFGIRGVRHARTRKLPAGVPATGVVICSLAVIVLGVGLVETLGYRYATLEAFRKRGLTQESHVR